MLSMMICALSADLLASGAQAQARPSEVQDFELSANQALATASFFFSMVVDATSRGEVIIGAIAPAGPQSRSFILTRLDSSGGHRQLEVSPGAGGVPFRLQGIKAVEDGKTLFAAEFGNRVPRLISVGRDGSVLSEVPLGTEAAPVTIHKLIAGPKGTVIGIGSSLEDAAMVSIAPDGQLLWTKTFDFGSPAALVDAVALPSGDLLLVVKSGKEHGQLVETASVQVVRMNPPGTVIQRGAPMPGRLATIARSGTEIGLVLDRSTTEEREFWFTSMGHDLNPRVPIQLGRALPTFARFAGALGAGGSFLLVGSTGTGTRVIEVREGRLQADTTLPMALASGDVWVTGTDSGLLMVVRTGRESTGTRQILESISAISIRRSEAHR